MRQRGDPLDLDRVAQLDLVAGDGRAAGEAGDLRVDLELVEHLGQRLDDLVRRRRAGPVRAALAQHVAGGQRVGDVAGQRELLDPCRQRRVRRRLALARSRPASRAATTIRVGWSPALPVRRRPPLPRPRLDRAAAGCRTGSGHPVSRPRDHRRRSRERRLRPARRRHRRTGVAGWAADQPAPRRARPRAGSSCTGVPVTTSRP